VLDHHEADVVARAGVLLARVAQADDQDRRIAAVTGVTAG